MGGRWLLTDDWTGESASAAVDVCPIAGNHSRLYGRVTVRRTHRDPDGSPDGGVRPIAANCNRCGDGRDTERHSQSGLPTIRQEGSGFAGRSRAPCPCGRRLPGMGGSLSRGGEDRPSSTTDRRLMTTSPCGTTVSEGGGKVPRDVAIVGGREARLRGQVMGADARSRGRPRSRTRDANLR
nr:unnamed protein product [Digitaria exilis]